MQQPKTNMSNFPEHKLHDWVVEGELYLDHLVVVNCETCSERKHNHHILLYKIKTCMSDYLIAGLFYEWLYLI